MSGPRSGPVRAHVRVRRPRRLVVALSSVTVAALALVACGESAPPEVPVADDGRMDPVLVEGAEIYRGRCAACHGSDGGGGRGPKVSEGRMVDVYPDLADQIAVIAEGRRAMPGFAEDLTLAEIEAVVRYTREVL